MPNCDDCDELIDLPYQCNYCDGHYCPDHRLPEGHDCDSVEFLSGGDRWFRDKSSGEVVHTESEFESPEPIEPEYTVGTMPPPEYESAPDVKLDSDREEDGDDGSSIVRRVIRRIFG